MQQLVASRDGSPALWQRGRWWVDRALGVADLRVSDGGGFAYTVTSTVDEDGTVVRSWPYYSHYTLSQDRRLVVGVGNADVSGAPLLEVAVLIGPSYAQADLAGDWVLHVLCAATPPEPSGWARASVRIDAGGAVALQSLVASGEGFSFPAESLEVDEWGGLAAGDVPSLAGQLAAGKSVLAATFTPDAGGACLVYGLRRRAPPPAVVLDGTGASAVVGAAGGAVEATGADGTIYRLEVPVGAIAGGDRTIALRPISGIERSPLEGPLLAGVQLEPEGLRLAAPAVLTIQLPASLAVPAVGFSWPGAGDDEVRDQDVDASGAATGRLALPVLHFSGSGVRTGGCSASCYFSRVTYWARLGEALGWGPNIDAEIGAVLHEWMHNLILPRAGNAHDEASLFAAFEAFLDWEAAYQMIYSEDPCTLCADEMNVLAADLQGALDALMKDLDDRCKAATNDCGRVPWIRKRVEWEARNMSMPKVCGNALTLPAKENFCGGLIRTTVVDLRMKPKGQSGNEGGAATFVAEPWTGLGQLLPDDVDPPPYVWASSAPEIALVFSTGPVATVSLRAPGDAGISASTGCVGTGARVHVYDRFNGRWKFSWGAKSSYSTRGTCQYFLHEPHPDEFGDVYVSHSQDGSASILSWTSQMLPAVDIDGPLAGDAGVVKGVIEDHYYSMSAAVGRTCTIRLHAASASPGDQPTATGLCSWAFADLVSGPCYGTDELKGVRVQAW